MPTALSISRIHEKLLTDRHITLDLLRADRLHPLISGNKWYKLKYNIARAQTEQVDRLLSFGGPYSNHLHALAYAGQLAGLKTTGIVRGEKVYNKTLADCERWGMQLHFISRAEYRQKDQTDFITRLSTHYPGHYIIPEGGNNESGIKGCGEMLVGIDLQQYEQIVCAVGTGATLSGLINASPEQIPITGFAVLKNGAYLTETVKNNTRRQNWTINSDYHFGGFGKRNNRVLQFMHDFNTAHQIELDFVYTAKMMCGLYDLIEKNNWKNTRILAIHTGGVQGNRSL